MVKKLQRTREYLKGIHKHVVSGDDDIIVLFIGDEGAGKSTFMLQCNWMWEGVRGNDPSVDRVLENVVWGDRDEFNRTLTSADEGDMITVQDAAHVFHNLEVMHGDQRESSKNLLDVRVLNYVFCMGYQDWDDVPDNLRRRRAKHVFRIYRDDDYDRGFVEAHGRDQLDEKYKNLGDDEWPDPVFEDRFPSLEGTTLWKEFNRRDESEKLERMGASQQIDEDDARKQEQIKTAIRARLLYREREDKDTLIWDDIEKLTDFSDTWCRQRFVEWKEGAYRDLVDEDDLVHEVA